MLSVDEAIRAVLGRAVVLPTCERRLIEALGLTLAEDVAADIDLPPFDKALMDGYAVRSADLASPGDHRLRVVEEIAAGRTPTIALGPGDSTRIMTGAPLPSGADAVVMVERTRALGDDAVLVPGPVLAGQNRLPRGREMRRGDILLARGARIDALKLGLMASAGRDTISVIPTPDIAVVATGDELVNRSRRPEAGQIRNTNSVMLAGLGLAWGARSSVEIGIAPDDTPALRSTLITALMGRKPQPGYPEPEIRRGRTDVLLVIGGVSAGTRDLVPPTLVDLGIEPVFHKVNVKPGKPIWFGVGPRREDGPGALVFGLPGNPASAAIGFLLFVRPALDALAGREASPPTLLPARLGGAFEHRGDRPTYHPARLSEGRATPLDWAGSADLRTIALADGFVLFPAGDRSFRDGEEVSFLPL